MGIELPGIYVEVKGDYSKLERDIRAVKSLVKEQATAISNDINNAISPNAANRGITSMVTSLGTLNRASAAAGGGFDKLRVDVSALTSMTGLSEKQMTSLQSRLLKTSAANAQEKALRSVGRSAGLTKKEVQQLGRQFNLSSAQIKKVNKQLRNIKPSMRPAGLAATVLRGKFLALGSVMVGAFGIGALVKTADQYTNIDSKLRIATGSTEEFNKVYKELFIISQTTGTSFATNAINYANLALALQDTNIESKELLQVFEDVTKSLTVSGAATSEVNSFLLQFKQSLGANRLAGDEFKGMLEANAYWAGKLAKALDTDIAGLYKMKEAGELTTRVVLDAHKKMSVQIAQDFDGLQKTIARAQTELSNAWKDIFAEGNRATGATNDIADAISDVATTVTENKDTISSVFQGVIWGAAETIDLLGDVTRSIQGLSIVAASKDKSLLDWIFADENDMKQWQADFDSGALFIEDRISELMSSIDTMSDRRALQTNFGGWTKKLESEYQGLIQERIKLESKLIQIRASAAAAKEPPVTFDFDASFDHKQLTDSAEKIIAVATETSEKIIHIRTDERHQALELSKDVTKDREKELTKEANAAAKELGVMLASQKDFYDELQLLRETDTETAKRELEEQVEVWKALPEDIRPSVDEFAEYYKIKLKEIEDANKETTGIMAEVWGDFGETIKDDASSALGDYFNGEFDTIGDAWDSLWDTALATFKNKLAEMAVEWAASVVVKWFTDDDTGSSGSDDSWWDDLWEFSKGGSIGYDSGGTVVGGSGKRDDVYAGRINNKSIMLTGGEFVVNREDAMKNRGLLNDINAGRVEGYRVGGSTPGNETGISYAGASFGSAWNDTQDMDIDWALEAVGFASPKLEAALRAVAAATAAVIYHEEYALERAEDFSEEAAVARQDVIDALDAVDADISFYSADLVDLAVATNMGLEPKATSEDIDSLDVSLTDSLASVSTSVTSAVTDLQSQVDVAKAQAQAATSSGSNSNDGGSSFAAPGEYFDSIGITPAGTISHDDPKDKWAALTEKDIGYDGGGGYGSGSGWGAGDTGMGTGIGNTGGGTPGKTPGGSFGMASGGVVDSLFIPSGWNVPPGDDGYAALSIDEGVIPKDTMLILSQLIKSGELGGGGGNVTVQIFLDSRELKTTIDNVIVTRERQGADGPVFI